MTSQSQAVDVATAPPAGRAATPASPSPGRAGPPTAEGFVLVDKPLGWTSHQVVGRLRRRLDLRKVGHAGTLDPLATGLLVCGVGPATRLLGYIQGEDKTYLARLRFGVETTTEDSAGHITRARGAVGLTRDDLLAAAADFLGRIEQVPSTVSAIKVDGQRAYNLVRKGEKPQLKARQVEITRLDWGLGQSHLVSLAQLSPRTVAGSSAGQAKRRPPQRDLGQAMTPDDPALRARAGTSGLTTRSGAPLTSAAGRPVSTPPRTAADASRRTAPTAGRGPGTMPPAPVIPVFDIDLTVDCSAGTYVRALARDLGEAVGTGAHLVALRRLRTGPFSVTEAALGHDGFKSGGPVQVLPVTAVMGRILPLRRLEGDLVRRVSHGQALDLALEGPTLLVGPADEALAVYAPAGDEARPQTVLVRG